MTGCQIPEHDSKPNDYCAACAAACEAELTRLNDLYMRLMHENAMWRTKATMAAERGEVPPMPANHREGTAVNAAGFELVDGNDVLQLTGRSTPAREDVLVGRIFHATTGGGRGILLRRHQAEALTAWLTGWLEDGWPGVPRACGRRHADRDGREWRCDQDPGHRTDHEGPCTGWRTSDYRQPGRERWPLADDEYRAATAELSAADEARLQRWLARPNGPWKEPK